MYKAISLSWIGPSIALKRKLCPKGQVTRAQEAEENYLIKRELATIKQQSDEAITKLEHAENTIRELQQQQQWVRYLVALHLIFLIRACLFLLVSVRIFEISCFLCYLHS